MNRQRGQVSTIAIVLLIVGLVVGAGGGYIFISNNLQPKIDDYEIQVMDLNTEVSNLSATVFSLEEEISDYETRDYEATLAMEQEITIYEDRVTSYESQVTGLETEIESLQALLEAEESNTYMPGDGGYGFSFEYPEGWTLYVSNLLGTLADEYTGTVTIASEDGMSLYSITWMARAVFQGFLGSKGLTLAEFIENPDAGLDYAYTILPVVELGERVTSTKDGNILVYQTGTMEGGEITRKGPASEITFNCLEGGEFIFAGWYSDESRNDYAFSVIMLFSPGYEPADIESTMLQFLETFECH